MKKQVITLTMCLAITTSSVIAASTKEPAKKIIPQAKVQSFSKALGKSNALPSLNQPQKRMTKEEAKKMFQEQRAKEREFMYNKLNFSAEQKTKAEAIDEKTKKEIQPLIKKLHEESKKMSELKQKKANRLSIWMQKQALKSAKNNVKKRMELSKKEFEALLNPAQKVKFQEIIDARKKDFGKFKNGPKAGEHGSRGSKPYKNGARQPKRPHGPHPNKGFGAGGPMGPEFMGPPSEGVGAPTSPPVE